MAKKMTLLVEKSDSCKKNSRSFEESFNLIKPGYVCFSIFFEEFLFYFRV